ncbi:hypothetical protein EP7_002845 [Isosphaeraceae bacterium EP7]
MPFWNNVLLVLGYFTPARSPMFTVAFAGTLAIAIASSHEQNRPLASRLAEMIGVSTNLGNDRINVFVESGAIQEGQLPQYSILDDSTYSWWLIILPIFLVLIASIFVSLTQYSHLPIVPPQAEDDVAADKEAVWKGQFNLSRAFCLSSPLLFLVLTVVYMPRNVSPDWSFYYWINYVVCIFQIIIFFLFMFAETLAKARHYNLIQFSLITTCFLIAASFENTAALEISNLKVESEKLHTDKISERTKQKKDLDEASVALNEAKIAFQGATTTTHNATGSKQAGVAEAEDPKAIALKKAKDRVESEEQSLKQLDDEIPRAQQAIDKYSRTNRPKVAMYMLYFLWLACMLFWTYYLKRMTKIKIEFSSPQQRSVIDESHAESSSKNTLSKDANSPATSVATRATAAAENRSYDDFRDPPDYAIS